MCILEPCMLYQWKELEHTISTIPNIYKSPKKNTINGTFRDKATIGRLLLLGAFTRSLHNAVVLQVLLLLLQDILAVDHTGAYQGYPSSLSIDVHTYLNSPLAQDTFHSSKQTSIGTLEDPAVIGLDLLPIYEFLNDTYFDLVSHLNL